MGLPEKGKGADGWFREVAVQSGIDHVHRNRVFRNRYAHIMQGYTALGASAAVADFDGDGWEDVFVTDSAEDGTNALYRNNGDFTFTDVSRRAGVWRGNDASNASADCLWLDYDNDGRPDLFVVRFGRSLLYRNKGDGVFQEVSRQAGLDRYSNAIAAISFDYDLDGDVDLFVGSYFSQVNIFEPTTTRFFPENFETAENGGGLTLYRNEGNGKFTDVSKEAGIQLSGWTLDLGHGDADGDGDDDLYVACDFGTDRFLLNNGDGTFTDVTESVLGFDTKKGMNVDWGDYDNDGYLDIYVTNITDDYMKEGNFLWRNNFSDDKKVSFSDVSRETETFDTGWGWAGKFLDYDHDGWLDLYVVNGWVSGSSESYVPMIFEMIIAEHEKSGGQLDLSDIRKWPPMGDRTLSGYQKMRLFRNHGGEYFSDEAPRHGLDSELDGRGIAVADFDRNGWLDLFVTIANHRPLLYRNIREPNKEAQWIAFELRGTRSNRFGIGAQVRVQAGGRTLLRFVDGGNGFASQSSTRVHFGLGAVQRVDAVDIRWPSGLRQRLTPLQAGRIYRITEGESEPRILSNRSPGAGTTRRLPVPRDRRESKLSELKP